MSELDICLWYLYLLTRYDDTIETEP